MGRERYWRVPRTIAWTICAIVLLGIIFVTMRELVVEHARRQAVLAHFQKRRDQTIQFAHEHRLATSDLAVLVADLERLGQKEAEEGNEKVAESYLQQAERNREELGRMMRDEALVSEWSRYYARMIKTSEPAVRLPLSRVASDPPPPPLVPPGMLPIE